MWTWTCYESCLGCNRGELGSRTSENQLIKGSFDTAQRCVPTVGYEGFAPIAMTVWQGTSLHRPLEGINLKLDADALTIKKYESWTPRRCALDESRAQS